MEEEKEKENDASVNPTEDQEKSETNIEEKSQVSNSIMKDEENSKSANDKSLKQESNEIDKENSVQIDPEKEILSKSGTDSTVEKQADLINATGIEEASGLQEEASIKIDENVSVNEEESEKTKESSQQESEKTKESSQQESEKNKESSQQESEKTKESSQQESEKTKESSQQESPKNKENSSDENIIQNEEAVEINLDPTLLQIVPLEDVIKENEKQNKVIETMKTDMVRELLANKGAKHGIVKQKDLIEPLTYDVLTKLSQDLRKQCEENPPLNFPDLDELDIILLNAHCQRDFELAIPYHILDFIVNQLDRLETKNIARVNRAEDFERISPAQFTMIERNPKQPFISMDAYPTKEGNEESNYIKNHVADALSKGLADLCLKRPNDPVYHLALFLRKYRETLTELKKKEKELLEKKIREEKEEAWMKKVRKELRDYIKHQADQDFLEEERKREVVEAELRRREVKKINKATEKLSESAFGPVSVRVFENEPTDLLKDSQLDQFADALLTEEELKQFEEGIEEEDDVKEDTDTVKSIQA